MSKLDKLSSLVPMTDIEHGAQSQIYDILSLDCLKKMAIMPDVHQGYDMPIGGVALLDGMISPSFVGYDIGCGMCFINTGISLSKFIEMTNGDFHQIYDKVLKLIPTGFSSLKKSDNDFKYASTHLPKNIRSKLEDRSVMQLGTLGGGNHFIEIGFNTHQDICITIHSGSRNVGHTICGYYMKQGRLLDIESSIGQEYLSDMLFAQEWALKNRLKMIIRVMFAMGLSSHDHSKAMKTLINENHNHAIVTKDGILHRKGATPADLGQLGIIPANMRDGVYITRGLGNEEFLSSASHGCGRVMGRNAAKKNLDYDKFKTDMRGVVCSTDRAVLEEAPDAYKNIDYVIAHQEGITVDIIDYINPLINIKGQGD